MFSPRTHRLGARVLDRLDLLVEFATLGGYAVDREGVFALEATDPGDAVRALALSGEGLVPMPRPATAFGLRAPAGQGWGDRTRGDCSQAGRLTSLCRGGAARP
jgi:hypothetical protein